MPVAHIGHVELEVTDIEASTRFFTDIYGLFVSDTDGAHVYLRAWQDRDHHTLILTEGARSGLAHIGWRVETEDDLAGIQRRLDDVAIAYAWSDGGVELGQGDGLRFRTPAGIPMELYWQIDPYVENAPALQSRLASHPQRYVGTGVAPRRLDHVNCLIDDVAAEQEWLTAHLGIHHRYYVRGDDGTRLGSWLSRTNVSHEIALMRNRQQSGSLLHHVGYYANSPDEVMRAATILAENGIEIEWGPGCHGTSGAIFLYCLEPSGHRIEVWTGGMLIFAPDWDPIEWSPAASQAALELWGSQMPDSYLTYGTRVLGPAHVDVRP